MGPTASPSRLHVVVYWSLKEEAFYAQGIEVGVLGVSQTNASDALEQFKSNLQWSVKATVERHGNAQGLIERIPDDIEMLADTTPSAAPEPFAIDHLPYTELLVLVKNQPFVGSWGS